MPSVRCAILPSCDIKRGASLCEQQLRTSSGAEVCTYGAFAHRLCTQLIHKGSGYGADYRERACGLTQSESTVYSHIRIADPPR